MTIAARRARIQNTARVLRQIWERRAISRIDIAKAVGLNRSTVTNVVADLIREGIVAETEEGDASPQGGRKPIFLSLDRSYGTVVGLEVRPESYTMVCVDLHGDILFSRSERMDNTIDLARSIQEIMEHSEADIARYGRTLGIGVGVSGIVDAPGQIIHSSIPLRILKPYDFRQEVGSRLPYPALPENDANCCVWGELAFNRDRALKNFAFVLVEFREISDREILRERIALGIGFCIGGTVYRGAGSSAGEFRSILRAPEHNGQFSFTPDELRVVDTVDEIRARFLRELARHIALFVNTLNLDVLFLGGDIERFQAEVETVIQEEIDRNWPYPGPVPCEIRFSSLRERSVAYGAAGLILDGLFSGIDPVAAEEGSVSETDLVSRLYTSVTSP